MRRDQIVDFADCSEFRQTLQARPPGIVHGTALLLILLLCGAVVWSSTTTVSLVVRAPGRVRPVSTPTEVSASFGERINGRVVEVNYREGEAVRKGQMLIRFDTQQLDNDIAGRVRAIETLESELSRLAKLRESLQRQFDAALAKAQAELDLAVSDSERARTLRETAVRLAEIEWNAASENLSRKRTLFKRSALSRAELMGVETAFQRAEEELTEVKLPVDGEQVVVARRAFELVEQNHVVEQAQLEIDCVTKEGELQTVREELTGLRLEHTQSVLHSPLDGIVITPAVKVGDVPDRGLPVLEIAARVGFHFEAAVPSEDVGHLRPGMPVRMKFDAYEFQEYGTLDGTVCFISPDSKIAPQNPDGVPVFLVKVELQNDTLVRGERRAAVRLGMTGQSEIIMERQSLLSLLFWKIRGTISFG